MTDITRALSDPELGSTPFRVIRPTYRISRGVTAETTQVFSASGCVQPGCPETTRLLPEEERHETHIVIYTVFPLSLGENRGADTWTGADRIAWGGKTWKLVSLQDWAPFRFYRAAAVEAEQQDGQG